MSHPLQVPYVVVDVFTQTRLGGNQLAVITYCSGLADAQMQRIANEFNEALGLQMNALIGLGCILFFVTFVVLVIARILVARVKSF